MQNIDISIIIATRGREKILWETVEKALGAVENKNTEIIVVNDGDSPLKVPVLYENKIQYFNNPSKGVSSARNFGSLHAKGEVLFFIDDDMWINSEAIDWIDANVVKNKREDAVFNINWEYPSYLAKSLIKSKIGQYILSSGYNTMWGRMHEKGNVPVNGLYRFHTIASCSLVLKKDVFIRAGMYNESIIFQGEDTDLASRLNALSVKIYSVFDVTLFHNHRDRIKIEEFLARLSNGHASEFNAEKKGLVTLTSNRIYKNPERIIFEFFRMSEKGWIILHKALPARLFMRPLNNRLTGILTGLQRYKEWRRVAKFK
jgi:glycosyltransferase involved in cell wall biosynthesis